MAFSASLNMAASLVGRSTFPSPRNGHVNGGVRLKQSKTSTFPQLSLVSFPRCFPSNAMVMSSTEVVHGRRTNLKSRVCYNKAMLEETPIGKFMREKLMEDNLKCADCAACSGFGYHVDPILKIIRIRCADCGGNGEAMGVERIETRVKREVGAHCVNCSGSGSDSGF